MKHHQYELILVVERIWALMRSETEEDLCAAINVESCNVSRVRSMPQEAGDAAYQIVLGCRETSIRKRGKTS